MTTVIKTLTGGYSGSNVLLMQDDHRVFVRKVNNIDRNYLKLIKLFELGYAVPKIYDKQNNVLDIEYFYGSDIRTFLLTGNPNKLTDYIINNIDSFRKTSSPKSYYNIIKNKLESIKKPLPFDLNFFLEKIPHNLESSLCHGDLTLDNIIYKSDGTFGMIDPSEGEFDSWIFDLAKLRQDLEGHWFLRNNPAKLEVKLLSIKNALRDAYPEAFDDNLYILMLLRVYHYTLEDSLEHKLILKEIERLWK